MTKICRFADSGFVKKHVMNSLKADCFEEIAKQYWFYLSFENSICNDYITEKFWRTLELRTVPVVMGGGNYLRDAPEKVICSYLEFILFKSCISIPV